MHEIALLLLLLVPSGGIFGGVHSSLTKYVSPRVYVEAKTTSKPVFIQPAPTQISAETLAISAGSLYSIDITTSAVLESKISDTKLQIASLTKLMTAYIILKDQPNLDKVVTIPGYSLQEGDAVMSIGAGEQLKLRDLLAGLLIPSGSDAAQALAIIDSGSVDAFVSKMNQKAVALGLTGTHFANPVGWDDPNNYSTARDIASLSRILIRNTTFAGLTSTKTKTIYTIAGRAVTLTNTNELLGNDGYTGVKTGFTNGAGQCLVSLRKVADHQVLTVVLGSTDRFGETTSTNAWTESHFLW